MFRRKKNPLRTNQHPVNPWIILAIGNPGSEYSQSRHNVGWWAADIIAARAKAALRDEGPSRIASIRIAAQKVVLAYPKTYVNRSGAAAKLLMEKYQTDTQRLIIISDDINLPPGRLRIRRQGGAGGHNGLRSIIDAIGDNKFPRIRIGVGKPPNALSQVDHVLSAPSAEELKEIDLATERAADALEIIVAQSIENAMNQFNRHEPVVP